MSDALAGRSALVTGASRGIGLAISRELVAEGARVLCLARQGRRLDEAVESLGTNATAVVCNLASSDEIDSAVIGIFEACGGAPDIVVQNAGHFPLAPFHETSAAEFGGTIQVNLIGPYRLAQPLAAGMRERGTGHVVTIGSIADRVAFPENVAYSASKFAARAVHEVLREELRNTGVRVTLVSPGPVDTTIWDAMDPDSRPGFTPRSRMLTPDAVADAVRWVVTRPAQVNVDELRLGRA
jgi:NADP-dependent 3-hydroxy acid dehydrogenase YdfG